MQTEQGALERPTVEPGTKLIQNSGAMFPEVELEVIAVDGETFYAANPTDPESTQRYTRNELRWPGERTANGSPIGVFVKLTIN